MSLDNATRERIASLIEANPVMLFMKGTPDAPGCGFSAQVVSILSGMLPNFGAFDVLNDPEVRQGIKEFSDWPTIPQLYVKGEFLGGCDIIKEMYGNGELHEALGMEKPEIKIPTIRITEDAAEMIRGAQAQAPSEHTDLHVVIDASFQHQLGFGPKQPGELEIQSAGLTLLLDADSASRADGLVIDVATAGDQKGLAVDNPNAPNDGAAEAVIQASVTELKGWLDRGEVLLLLDVRTEEERAKASIPGARLVDDVVVAEIELLPKDTKLVFHCHHGGRSQAASEHFVRLGFTQVYNVTGGIEAWSREIDTNVPRY